MQLNRRVLRKLILEEIEILKEETAMKPNVMAALSGYPVIGALYAASPEVRKEMNKKHKEVEKGQENFVSMLDRFVDDNKEFVGDYIEQQSKDVPSSLINKRNAKRFAKSVAGWSPLSLLIK